MSAVMVDLTHKPEPITLDPNTVILVSDVAALTEGTVPACNDDNPYQ